MCSAYCDPLNQDSQHLLHYFQGSHNISGISISELDWCTPLQTISKRSNIYTYTVFGAQLLCLKDEVTSEMNSIYLSAVLIKKDIKFKQK